MFVAFGVCQAGFAFGELDFTYLPMAARDISKYIIDVTDNTSWQSMMDLSDEKLIGIFSSVSMS
jgi:hypothetical protein